MEEGDDRSTRDSQNSVTLLLVPYFSFIFYFVIKSRPLQREYRCTLIIYVHIKTFLLLRNTNCRHRLCVWKEREWDLASYIESYVINALCIFIQSNREFRYLIFCHLVVCRKIQKRRYY